MNPTINNAFSDGDPQNTASKPGSATFGKGLAASLSPMQAVLKETHYGWSLQLSPIRAFDALRVWTRMAADATSSDGEEPVSVLFDVAFAPRDRHGSRDRLPALAGGSLGELADRLGIATISRFEHVLGDQLVMFEAAQRELIGTIGTSRVRSVLVAGPVEQSDGKAMMQAIEAGRSPLEVEFRAIAALEVQRDRVATLHVRDKDYAAMMVAENFRHYLAALRSRPASEFATPEPSQLRRLLEVSGSITVRPIETDVFSTSIDVGISTATDGRRTPADKSLIYDVPSNTWHDEP